MTKGQAHLLLGRRKIGTLAQWSLDMGRDFFGGPEYRLTGTLSVLTRNDRASFTYFRKRQLQAKALILGREDIRLRHHKGLVDLPWPSFLSISPTESRDAYLVEVHS
jgi:hypothetical protein